MVVGVKGRSAVALLFVLVAVFGAVTIVARVGAGRPTDVVAVATGDFDDALVVSAPLAPARVVHVVDILAPPELRLQPVPQPQVLTSAPKTSPPR